MLFRSLDTIVDSFKGAVAVRNLCSGGSITLYRQISLMSYTNTVTYHYIATGRFPDGSIGVDRSPDISLNNYNVAYQNGQSVDWEVRLRKVQ